MCKLRAQVLRCPRTCIRFGEQITYTPKQTSEYEKLVRASYTAVSKMFFYKNIPLEISIVALFSIPQSKGKKLKDSMLKGYILPTKKPYSDNIIKIILDSLNGVCYHDDAQICKLSFEKRYLKISRVEVKIKSLEEKINMKTTKIYNNEKEVYIGNCYVNTVIFRGRIYDDFKDIKSNGIKFLLQISNGKDDITGQWNKPILAECCAFGETTKRIAKYYSKEAQGKYYKGSIVREIITEQEIKKSGKTLLDDNLPF